MLIISLVSVLVLIGIDRAIKQWAVLALSNIDTIPVIKDVLHLTYVENRGAAFGIFKNSKWFLLVLTSLIAIAALVLLISGKLKNKLAVTSMTLIVAGGVGNLIDRIARGYVVDYIDFRLINFAVFNFADCCVVVGTILFAAYILFIDGKDRNIVIPPLHEDEPGSGDDDA